MADPRIEHLLRRAGFGASADELADYSNTRSYSATVDRLISYELIDDDVDAKIGQPGAWARNVVETVCPASTVGTSFDVRELEPQDGLAHVGSVLFVPDETRTDQALGVELGMPRDLDGDGAADKTDALPTATVLPVIIEMRWKGIRGNQRIVHPFFVASY